MMDEFCTKGSDYVNLSYRKSELGRKRGYKNFFIFTHISINSMSASRR